ncbi:hypothetical protein Bca101_014654 [Brassica carinata]
MKRHDRNRSLGRKIRQGLVLLMWQNLIVELQPHPVKEQLPGVQYCVNSPPPWLEAVVLGFQHYLLSLGITVLIPSLLVPLMGGGDAEKARVIQTMLFVSGLTTLLHSFFGTRLPVIAAASYAYIIPITSIISSTRFSHYTDPFERFVRIMRSIQGALLVAGCFQVLVCFLGVWRNIARFLSPLSIAPLTTFAGLGLYQIGFPLLARCVEVGLPGLILLVFVTQLCYSHQVVYITISLKLLKLVAVQIVMVSSPTLLGQFFYLNVLFCPTFHFTDSFAMMAASFVTLFESTGLFYASARYGSATPIPPSVISRGTGWLGVGVLLNSMFGGVSGITTSTENVGLLAMTKIGSRRVIQISAAFMLFFSIFGKFGAFFASIPLPIMASVYCIVLCFVSIVLDCTLSRESDEAKKDCGLKWWEKFRLYNLDVRNDEFYGLPCCLNKFFPSH